ncbi:MAG: hypothetical protein QXT73_06950 [Candidatus Methanomethylicaceae archaeon]
MDYFICRECGNRKPMRDYVDILEYEGICYGCYKQKPKHICVDFDGVLAEYDGWRGPSVLGKPMEGAKDFLVQLVRMGYRVVVHTAREPLLIRNWLKEHGMFKLVSKVTKEKIPASAYIDDRAICFRGSFEDVLEAVKGFRPYWKKEGN